MQPRNLSSFEQLISTPRLDSYRRYFQLNSSAQAIALTMWNCELGACFGALFSFLEIALRNNIHRALSQQYCGGAASGHWYDVISLNARASEQINEIRCTRKKIQGNWQWVPRPGRPPTADEIVSRLSFGFWTNVLGAIHKSTAHKVMPVIFPNHPLSAHPQYWSDAVKKSAALAFTHEINVMRNRIAHHEPLWKFPAILNTAVHPAQVLIPASANYAQSIQRLTRLLGLYDQAMAAFDADLHREAAAHLVGSAKTEIYSLLRNQCMAQ